MLLVVYAQPGPECEELGPLHYVDGVDLEATEGVHNVVDVFLAHLFWKALDKLLLDHELPRSLLGDRHYTG